MGLSQIQQPQIHQIQQLQVQQTVKEKQILSIPENLNSGNESDSEWDGPMNLVFSIRRNIILKIPHGLTRGPVINENNRNDFNRDQ